jgi:tetratricopeptide (TPR) repeat protein/4-amino-4-deoxy-L-arabinose transferase-like glycosyltransferase
MLKGIHPNDRQWAARASLLLPCAAAIAVYVNTLFYGFVWDDFYLIVEDHTVKSFHYLGVIFSHDFFGHQEDDLVYGYFRPLVTLSYAIDYAVWQANPFGFHLTNILLHALSAMLVAAVMLKLSVSRTAAIIAALLFAVHPMHTENSAWISGRTDMIAFVFSLLAMLLHMSSPIDRPCLGRRVGAGVLFGAALLAKEMAVVVLIWIPAIEFICFRREWRPTFRASLPYIGVLGAYLLWRFVVVDVRAPFQPSGVSWFDTVLTAPWTIARYLAWLVFPVGQNAYVQNPYIEGLGDFRLYIGVVVVGALVFAFVRVRKAFPMAACLLVMLGASFLPILNFIRIAGPEDMGDMMAERFLYFPSFPFIALGVICAETLLVRVKNLPQRRFIAYSLTAIVAVSAGWGTMKRNRVWENNEVFYSTTLDASPSALIWCNLANHYIHSAKWKEAKDALDNAEKYFADDYHYFSALALWHAAQHQYEEAIELQEKVAAKVTFGRPAAYNNLAFLYRSVGNFRRAEALLLEVIDNGMGYHDVYFNLAEVYRATGRTGQAVAYYRKALDRRPDNIQTASALGALLIATSDLQGAADVFKEQLQMHRDNPGLLNNLGVVYMKMNRFHRAEETFLEALASDSSYGKARLNLALALRAENRPQEAVMRLQELLKSNPSTAEAKTAMKLLSDLQSPVVSPTVENHKENSL